MGSDITELSLMAAILAGAVLTSDYQGWLLTCGTKSQRGDRLSAVATENLKKGYLRNVKRGVYGVTKLGKAALTSFKVPGIYERLDNA